MKTEQRAKTPGSDSTPRPVAGPGASGHSKLQRSPILMVLGLLVLASGAVFGWFMWATTSSASEVVAAKPALDAASMLSPAVVSSCTRLD